MIEIGTWTWTAEGGQPHDIREWEETWTTRNHPFRIDHLMHGWTMTGEEHEVWQETQRAEGPDGTLTEDYWQDGPMMTREQVGLHFQDLVDEESRKTS